MTQHSCPLSSDVLERALARVGYYSDTKKGGRQIDYIGLLDWFVRLGRLDQAKLTPAERLMKHEEYRALQQTCCNLTQNDEGAARDFLTTQASIAKHLAELTETGTIELGPFQLSLSITIPRFDSRLKEPMKYSVYSGERAEVFEGKGLILLFGRTLERSGGRLRHCNHCSNLFVQARPKQRYCTRECQQVAAMRDFRRRQMVKAEKEAAERSKRKTRGSSHGAKKRTR